MKALIIIEFCIKMGVFLAQGGAFLAALYANKSIDRYKRRKALEYDEIYGQRMLIDIDGDSGAAMIIDVCRALM